MDSALKTYAFDQVACIVGGVQIHGFVDGDDAISVEPNADDWELYEGNDGEVTRSKTSSKLSKVTIKLAQSSASNAYLAGLLKAGSIVPFMLKDGSGFSLHVSEQAFLLARPKAPYGKKVNDREYVLACPNMVSTEAGN